MDIVIAIKQLHFIATPIGFIVSLTVLAIGLSLLNYKLLSASIMLFALITLWICSTPWVSLLAAKRMISDQVIETPFEDLPKVDAIVVFTWLEPFEESSWKNKFYDTRLESAKSIFQNQQVPILVGSSQYPLPKAANENEKTFTELYLLEREIPADKILIAPLARSSHEGVVAVKLLLDQLNIDKFILIASDIRMPRKYLSFKKLYENTNVEIIPYSNYKASSIKSPSYTFHQWVPNVRTLSLSTTILHEYLGLLLHRFMGWI